MLDFLDPKNTWLQAAGALALLLAGYYLGVGERRRERWHAVVDEVRPMLERQLGAVSPSSSGLDGNQKRRLVREMVWWKRHMLRRALGHYESQRIKWHQDEMGQPLFDDPVAHDSALKQLLRLLT